MKFKRKFVYVGILIAMSFHLLFSRQMNAQVVPEKKVSDSLCNALHTSKTDKEKIKVLMQLVNLYWQLPEEVTYMKLIIELADKDDDMGVVYNGLAGLCRYYYNDGRVDSILYWKRELDSLSLARKEYPEAIFRAGMIVCKKHLEEANYELAMNEAIHLLNKAKTGNHEYGLMTANQNLGLIYQTVKRDSEAVLAFREGMKWEQNVINRPGIIMQFLSDMLVSTLRLNHIEESEDLLEKYLAIYNEEDQKFKKIDRVYPMQWHLWIIYSFYTELYVRTNRMDKAAVALKKATEYIYHQNHEPMEYIYFQAAALYYQKIGDTENALQAIDKSLALNEDLDMLKRKVDVLKAAGQIQKAVNIYEFLLQKNSEISNDAFERQMKQLRILSDLNDKNKQKGALRYQGEQIALKQRLLLLSIFFSVVLLALLYSLTRYYRHTRRLKNELVNEKESLVASERMLQEAKEEAENANQKKTTFIANISHEVRTPLNAIVGFSEILATQNIEEDEKISFADIINKNSDTLMNLVNDVLDLSRLESANFSFSLGLCEIVGTCQGIVAEAVSKLNPGVRLIFNSPVESYELVTDLPRVCQLIRKLLWNAMKFTEKGDISLSFEIDNDSQECRFVVTDTGCGIPVEKRKLVFERFEKLDDFVQGTGLGLPICQLIAKRLGGTLFIDPDYVKGTRFIFIHPLNLKT